MICKSSVFEAADTLAAKNEKVTLEAVRTIIGSGSFTTIRKYLDEWKTKRTLAGLVTPAPVPDDVEQACAQIGKEIWALASSSAERRLTAERDALTKAKDAAETSIQEAMFLADSIDLELVAARGRISALEAEVAEQKSARREVELKLAAETALRIKAEAQAEQREKAQANLLVSASEQLAKYNNAEGKIASLAQQCANLLEQIERSSSARDAS